jgi:hypothetical protein
MVRGDRDRDCCGFPVRGVIDVGEFWELRRQRQLRRQR